MSRLAGGYRESVAQRLYSATDKEPSMDVLSMDLPSNRKEEAYWRIGEAIEYKFPEGGTLSDIYHEVTGPMGLSLDDTRVLISGAIKAGYLR